MTYVSAYGKSTYILSALQQIDREQHINTICVVRNLRLYICVCLQSSG